MIVRQTPLYRKLVYGFFGVALKLYIHQNQENELQKLESFVLYTNKDSYNN